LVIAASPEVQISGTRGRSRPAGAGANHRERPADVWRRIGTAARSGPIG